GIAAGSEFWGGAFGWSETVYRTWYLIGAFFVAAYLGAGTVLLLAKTRFGYFVGGTVLFGGLLSLLFSHSPRYPGAATAGNVTFAIALVGGIAIIAATASGRELRCLVARRGRRPAPGQTQLARAGHDPDRRRSVHPRPDQQPEPLRRHLVVLSRRVPGPAPDLRGLPRERGCLQKRANRDHP